MSLENTRLRVLLHLWDWAPKVRPEVSRGDGRYFLTWNWAQGARATKRLQYLCLSDQLIQEIRRRVYVRCTNEELSQLLQQAKLEFTKFRNLGFIEERLTFRLLDDGTVDLMLPDNKRKPTKEERAADEAALKLLEEEEAEAGEEESAGPDIGGGV